MMKQSEEYVILVMVVAAVCACSTGYPLSQTRAERLANILEELKAELTRNRKPVQEPSFSFDDNPSAPLPTQRKTKPFGSLGLLPLGSLPSAFKSSNRNEDDSLSRDVDKRQGGWADDYGLGGGRFGKRGGMFADYSLGGGRFGRDVDHVTDLDLDYMED